MIFLNSGALTRRPSSSSTCTIQRSSSPSSCLQAERDLPQPRLQLGADGRLKYPELVFGAPKKSGKTTLAPSSPAVTMLLFGTRHPEAYCVPTISSRPSAGSSSWIRRDRRGVPAAAGGRPRSPPTGSLPSHRATITAIAIRLRQCRRWPPRTSPCFDELWAFMQLRTLTPAVGRNDSGANKNHQLPADRDPRWF